MQTVQEHMWRLLSFSRFLESLVQFVIATSREGQRRSLIIIVYELNILYDVTQQVRSLNTASRCFITQVREVHMQMVIRWLVVKVNSQVICANTVLLLNCFL